MASLKNKNDFLITPKRRAGSSKKDILERNLENKMLKYWCEWQKTITDYSHNQSLEGVAETGFTSWRATKLWKAWRLDTEGCALCIFIPDLRL